MLAKRLIILTLCVVGPQLTRAQTSLYIPGFDPQPISAGLAGVGSDGRTTWILQPGQPTGTDDESGFSGTATLVEGPNDAFLTLVDNVAQLTLAESCTISSNLAICTAVAGGSTVVATETASPIAVQVGSATAVTSGTTPSITSGGSNNGSPAGASNTGSGSSQTSNGAPASQTSASPNSGMKHPVESLLVALGVVGIMVSVA